jgi:alpha-1,3-rhamnosyl/mannosyltransferase
MWELVQSFSTMPQIQSLSLLKGTSLLSELPYPGTEPGLAARLLRRALMRAATFGPSRDAYALLQSRVLNGHPESIVHGPNYYLPKFTGRSLVTIHDLSVFKYPEMHPPSRVKRLVSEINKSMRRANAVITDSAFTRQEVIDFFGWDPNRIHAVSLAASAEFHPRDSRSTAAALARHGLQWGRYCLFAGTIEPRKNIEALLDAYGALPARLRNEYPLVVVGFRGWRSDSLHARLADGATRGDVIYLGYVDAETLPVIHAGARLFVYPSHYEGFGLPVLEAMASGIPVVCSNATSLPEVAGDAAAQCDPNDIAQLAALMRRGLEDDSWQSEMRPKALARAEYFSWHRTATETAAVYQLSR